MRVLNGAQSVSYMSDADGDETQTLFEQRGLDMVSLPPDRVRRSWSTSLGEDYEPWIGTLSPPRTRELLQVLSPSSERLDLYYWKGATSVAPPLVTGRIISVPSDTLWATIERGTTIWQTPTYWWAFGHDWLVATYTDAASSFVFTSEHLASAISERFGQTCQRVTGESMVDDWARYTPDVV